MNFPCNFIFYFYVSPMLTWWIAHNALQQVLPCDSHSSAQTSLTCNKTISNFKNSTARVQRESQRVLETTDMMSYEVSHH